MSVPDKRRSVFNRLRYMVGGNVKKAKSELQRLFGVDHPDNLSTSQLGELIELVGHGRFGVTDFRKTPINNSGDDTDDEPELTVADLVPSTDGSRRADISSPEAVAKIYKVWNTKSKSAAPLMGGKVKLTDKRFSK